ncbi:MAG: hypothetical protein MK110_07185 [Fuerstiella sp.]|nr:hypothetical protein [Fuerstiella sp.]
MSERLVIRCPGCDRKLGLKQRMLGQQIKCPECGTALKARTSKTQTSNSGDLEQQHTRRSESSGRSADEEKSSPQKRRSKRSSSTSLSGSNPSKQADSSSRQKVKPAPAPIEEEFADDEWYKLDDNYSDYDDYSDDFPNELYANDAEESWLDNDYGADWNSPEREPTANKKQTTEDQSGNSSRKRKRKSKRPRSRRGPKSVFVWTGAGLFAGAISVALTAAMGFTGIGFLIYGSSIVAAGLIGGAIRGTSGTTYGWGPGLVAVAIAVPAIFLGRVGAYFVDPELSKWFEEETPEQTLQNIDRDTSDDGMIANLIHQEVSEDLDWLRNEALTQVTIYSEAYKEAWTSDDFDEMPVPYREQFKEPVWAEGERRWNKIPSETRTEQKESRRLQLMLDYDVMDQQSMDNLLVRRTSDDAMIERISDDVIDDSAWVAESGVAYAVIERHHDLNFSRTTPEARVHPLVWEESSRRWSELNEESRKKIKNEVELELYTDIEIAADVKAASGTFRIGAAIIFAIVSLVMPIMPILFTISAVALAFSTGSGMETG